MPSRLKTIAITSLYNTLLLLGLWALTHHFKNVTDSFHAIRSLNRKGIASLMTFNVGQGSCHLLSCPGTPESAAQEYLLFDCGSSKDLHLSRVYRQKMEQLPQLLSESHQNTLIVSHADLDHYNIAFALKPSLFKTIYLGGHPRDYPSHPLVQRSISAIPQSWQTCGSARYRLIQPRFNSKHKNQQSLVLLIEANKKKLLLTADIPGSREEGIMKRFPFAKIDMVTLSHHGASSLKSNQQDFFDFYKPNMVVNSSGFHPHWMHPRCTSVQHAERLSKSILQKPAKTITCGRPWPAGYKRFRRGPGFYSTLDHGDILIEIPPWGPLKASLFPTLW